MLRHQKKWKNYRRPKRIWLLAGLLSLAVVGIIAARHFYYVGLGPVSDSQQVQIFTVEKGSTVKQIAVGLEEDQLIRSAWAFQLYVHSKELGGKLQAGTYALSPSQGTAGIVKKMTVGQVATRLVTILPGNRIDQVRADLINSGFSPDAVDKALEPGQYSGLPVMAFKPAGVETLEGLLWPDSYQKGAETDPSVIVRLALEDMGEHLTPDIQAAFAAEGLTTYQGLTVASIIVKEVNKPVDQAQAAQVFLTRLKSGGKLGSDVTAKYGAIMAGKTPNLSYDSPYNTHLYPGLPPTPISTININALNAAAHPANTNWLFFVSGDDGVTYFSNTLEEHEALTEQHCHKLCGR